MVKEFLLSIFLLFSLTLCFACKKTEEIKMISEENEIDFCSLVETPQKFKSKLIQTKGIVLGFHSFIFYSSHCLEQEKILALQMDYESHKKLNETIISNKLNYKTSFLNSNLYAEVSVVGELKENDENEFEVFHPKYKFFVKTIKLVNIISEEVFPTKKE